jgi:hypothetical protein
MSEEIIVTIKKGSGGQSTIEAKGFVGAACLKATEGVERAIGKTTSSVPTGEMRQTTATLKVGA